MINFVKAYIKSMRLYYAFVTGIAGWVGVSYFDYIFMTTGQQNGAPSLSRKVIILVLLFLSWGVNQIINDFLGLKEDRINAPHRPMVTGELDPKKALLVSGVLLLIDMIVIILYLEPISLIPAVLGILLNVLYEHAKGHGILGNIVFGLMISMCTVFGFLAKGNIDTKYFTSNNNALINGIAVFIMICVLNGLMTFYTYFKDYNGDKEADKNTVVVKLGVEKSRFVALWASIIPGILFFIFYLTNIIDSRSNYKFIVLASLVAFLELWTGYLYYRNPTGEKTYYSLKVNFRACACGQAALIALFDADLAMVLFIISYIFIGFLFDLHSNTKA